MGPGSDRPGSRSSSCSPIATVQPFRRFGASRRRYSVLLCTGTASGYTHREVAADARADGRDPPPILTRNGARGEAIPPIGWALVESVEIAA